MTDTILSASTEAALGQMIDITKEMILAIEAETNAIAVKSVSDLKGMSEHKQEHQKLYQKAAEEFMARLNEFTRRKNPRLKELQELNKELRASTTINLKFLDEIIEQA
ncbi:MAG: hypothetical protein CMH26_00235 [Micavibrio sp.]|nr:hypothetical protein [Micavibrio sp.]|tara:strand:- start:1023 stop:1346 length:324 start_codon:yes stop_codon:yes gene_type:complete